MTVKPDLSIIVITHNRARQLEACLGSLAEMHVAALRCELVVILDSCRDTTPQIVESLRAVLPFPLVVDSISSRRPSAGRNRGAHLAKGSTLLFLDDDVIAAPDLAMEHWRSHEKADVVVGYLKPGFLHTPGFWQLGARIWWEDRFKCMMDPEYELGFRDLFTANVSINARLFHSLGGFDEKLIRLEDYELGIRLMKAGASFLYNPLARATHFEDGKVTRWIRRAALEAEAELHMGTIHPTFRNLIFKYRLDKGDQEVNLWSERIRRTAFRRSLLFDALQRLGTALLPILETLKARQTWRMIMGAAHEYCYWRALANHFRQEIALISWIAGGNL
jgi:GT2 family glycosyltransferase